VTHDQEEAFDLGDRIGVMSYGRLLEVGTPEELYRQPKTEVVATFLGTGNLLVGEASNYHLKLGPLDFDLPGNEPQWESSERVQVLFRPEDVTLSPTADGLESSPLGCGVVQEVSFSGAFERVRLVMPPLPGVRPIAPKIAYGSRSIGIESTRIPENSLRFPLKPGDQAWIGVRRFHALQHPGLNILIVTDGSLRSQSVLTLGGQISRMTHARVTLLGCAGSGEDIAPHLLEARKILGSGLASLNVQTSGDPIVDAVKGEVEQQQFDLVILAFHPHEDVPLAEELLQFGEHHLLLVPAPQSIPEKALISVTGGEPGKDAIFFAGRLLRHLGTSALLMSVTPEDAPQGSRNQHFLDDGIQTLALMDIEAQSVIRSGPVKDAILQELGSGGYGMLVLGSPLPNRLGKISLEGLFGRILRGNTEKPTLIVRSRFVSPGVYTFIREKTRPIPDSIVRGER